MSIYAVNGKEPIAAWIPSLDTAGNGTTTLTDLVGSNNGTLTNMDAATDWVADTGAGGVRALDFDGVNDFVSAIGIPVTSTTFSLSSWVKRAILPNFPRIVDISDGVSSFQLLIDEGGAGNNQLKTKHSHFQTGLNSTTWGFRPANNTWEHIVAVVNSLSGTTALYRNGTLQTGTASAHVGAAAANNALRIGSRRDGNSMTFMQGLLDDIRIFDQALDADDVTALYASGNGRGITFGGTTIQTRRRRQLAGYGL